MLAEDGYDPAGDDAGTILAQVEGGHALRLLEKLEPQHREVLTLRFEEEMKIEDIAQVTAVPVSTAKSRLRRSLEQLREALDARYRGAPWQ